MERSSKDYYEILCVNKDASRSQIKEAYRKLAFEYHPDRNQGNPAANEKMKDINEAYATLSDHRKRSEYDHLRQQYGAFAYDRFRQSHSAEDIFRGSDINKIFEEFSRMFGFRNSDEIFQEFYGPGYRTFEFRGPGLFTRGFMFYGPSEKNHRVEGTEVHTGHKSLPGVQFPGIGGKLSKYVMQKVFGIQIPERGQDWQDTIILRPEEAEMGGELKYSYKKWKKPRNVIVKVPAGIQNGQRIRLRGMGASGKGGGEPGNLYIRVRIGIPLSERIKKLFK